MRTILRPHGAAQHRISEPDPALTAQGSAHQQIAHAFDQYRDRAFRVREWHICSTWPPVTRTPPADSDEVTTGKADVTAHQPSGSRRPTQSKAQKAYE
ncbi:hypothetical protein [Streptomyces wuyuanensis]|uniref:hypothetical protein n=1 Tax=Streptomyces wuyuanensis TaxID=1196353 RepID=UPI0037177B83